MKKFLLIFAIFLPLLAAAEDDFGLWYSIGAEKKIDKRWSAEIDGEFRTRNDARTADRWSIGADVDYRILKWLKASAGYSWLYNNNPEKITYHTDGSLNGWRPSYWGSRHRFNISLQGKISLGRFDISLRERWQYTYRPGQNVKRYDFDDNAWDYNRHVRGKGSNVLRSRLQADWSRKKCPFNPYASVELFNNWVLDKTRLTLGCDYKINKHNVVGLAYRFQATTSHDDDDEPNSHILQLSYQFKF